MKKFLLLVPFLFPISLFAAPVDSIGIDINTITCPNWTAYGFCWGSNAELHNKFVAAMKKKDATSAIKYWNKMSQTVDGSDEQFTLENILLEPLFGTYESEWNQMLPGRILAKKAFKWGIITLGTDCIQDCDFSLYFLSFIRYKGSGMLYVYNESLIPINSNQYKAYSKLYMDSYTGSRFPEFDKDITASFIKWKFNNKDTNTVYQKFIRSIR